MYFSEKQKKNDRYLWPVPELSEQPETSTDANPLGADSTVSLLTVQEKRWFGQQSTVCHTGPMAPQQLINGYDITALNTTKAAKA